MPAPPASFVARLPHGVRLKLLYGNAIGLWVLTHGHFEKRETEILASYGSQDGFLFDIGANVGAIAVPLAAAVKGSATVVAIEPLAENVKALRENVALNSLTNVVVHPVALGEEEGEADLLLSDDPAFTSTTEVPYSLGTGASVPIRVERLDRLWEELGSPPVAAMKVDVEGGELAVLAGGEQLLRTCRPALILEWNDSAHLAALTEWLGERGYRDVSQDGLVPWNSMFVWDEAIKLP